MRNIYVVAHSEATHHVAGVVGGWHDSQLTPVGVRDAFSIAEALRGKIPEESHVVLFSSDLQRALQTAKIVGDVLHITPLLDQHFIPPPLTGDRMQHDEGVPGAETKEAFAQRVYAIMDVILESNCEHLVIVTHGFAITFIVASWIGMPIESLGYVNFRVASGSITTLREDDYFHNRQVVSLSDTLHLAHLTQT